MSSSLAEDHWKKAGTTDVIERASREVRRGTRPVSSLSEPASCERIVFGIISHLNRSCSEKPLPEFSRNALRSAGKCTCHI
jgi:transposase-like protein